MESASPAEEGTKREVPRHGLFLADEKTRTPPPSNPPTEIPCQRGNWRTIAAPLLVVILVCLLFRLPLATGDRELLCPLEPELVAQPWKLLLPYDLGGHRYRWTTTGFAVVGLLNLVMPAPMIFLALVLLLPVGAYVLSWLTFRSRVFSVTLALCLGMNPSFNVSYYHNGSHFWPLLYFYLLLNLYFLHALATRPTTLLWPRLGFALSLVLLALCWEVWLDYLVFLLVFCAFGYGLCRRNLGWRAAYQGRILFVTATGILMAVVYLAVRIPYAGEHLAAGHESDTIFTYSSVVLAVDDVIGNVFIYPYLALTNYLPSWFTVSNSLYRMGPDRILAEQHGYHPAKAELVPMHHLFFWHFYAGAVLVVFGWYMGRTLRKAWTEPERSVLILAGILLLIATGFATHVIIKFRPYLSVPLLSYKCPVSVLAVALLIAERLTALTASLPPGKKVRFCLACAWIFVVVAAVERTSLQAKMGDEAGVGPFPNPIRIGKQILWQRSEVRGQRSEVRSQSHDPDL